MSEPKIREAATGRRKTGRIGMELNRIYEGDEGTERVGGPSSMSSMDLELSGGVERGMLGFR